MASDPTPERENGAPYGLHAPDADGAQLGLPGAVTLKDLGGSERVLKEILEPLLRSAPRR